MNHDSEQARHSSVRGALAGVVATGAMSGLMLGLQQFGLLGKTPPRKISERLLAVPLRRWPHRRKRKAISVINHLAFGAVAGALFPVLSGRASQRPARMLLGMAYGAAVWFGMYGYVLPAVGLMPSMRRDRRDRPVSMAASHLIYGAVLGALT